MRNSYYNSTLRLFLFGQWAAAPFQTAMVALSACLASHLISAQCHARVWIVNQQHSACDDQGPGTEDHPFKTISRAAAAANPGDTVRVFAGIYRERVSPAQGGTETAPIVYEAASQGDVVIKGSEPWQPDWQRVNDRLPIYRGKLDPQLFAGLRIHPYQTPLAMMPSNENLTLGQIFVNGVPYREVSQESSLAAEPSSWRVSSDGTSIEIHFADDLAKPAAQIVELTVRDRIFAPRRRGLGYIHVKGFVMEHCANQFPHRFWQSEFPQAGALGCRAGHHWVIEGNTVRFAKSIGIDCGYEGRRDLEGQQPTPQNTGYHLIRGNTVSDNGCCGIAGMRSQSTRILANIIERNNRLMHTAPEIGGIKVHYFIDGLIAGNLIRDNAAHGIWIDNVYRQSRVTRNLVTRNRGNGIFVELGEGPLLVDHNVVLGTLPGGLRRDPRGDGLYSHDASGICFAHNLVAGSHRFGSFHLKATNRARAAASRIQLLNNIYAQNRLGAINLPLDGPLARNNRSDHNVFDVNAEFLVNPWGGLTKQDVESRVQQKVRSPIRLWNDAAPRLSLAAWQRVTGWDLLSRPSKIVVEQPADSLFLQVDLEPTAVELPALPVPGVTHDFLGQPLPAKNSHVGPFQQLREGQNQWTIWPVPIDDLMGN